ncbi:MAG: hypothetical protein ACO1TE_12015 [Prosthecobacter sp.]
MTIKSVRMLIAIVAVLGGGLFLTLPAGGADGPAAAFVGDWCNRDFDTRGITRVRIYLDEGKIMVHMWGRCHPMECDWGETVATITPEDKRTLALTWEQGFATSVQKLILQEDGTLWLSGDRSYKTPNRPPLKETGVYEKGLEHNWSDPGVKPAPPKPEVKK